MMMRLDKFIGHASDFSRSQIRVLINQGSVSINNVVVTKASQHVNENDQIHLHGELLQIIPVRYLMLHKPAGYICANSDSEHPTIIDLLDEPNKHLLQIVGRLDIDTSGLIFITDDGQWNHSITSPRSRCDKTYRITTADPIDPHAAALFAQGVALHGEKKPTEPAHLEQLDSHNALLTIHEGKYHQVKRMFAATGNRVVALHRERIGHVQLDPTLKPGEYRHLTLKEIKGF